METFSIYFKFLTPHIFLLQLWNLPALFIKYFQLSILRDLGWHCTSRPHTPTQVIFSHVICLGQPVSENKIYNFWTQVFRSRAQFTLFSFFLPWLFRDGILTQSSLQPVPARKGLPAVTYSTCSLSNIGIYFAETVRSCSTLLLQQNLDYADR